MARPESGWFALFGLAAMAVPTLVSLARMAWSTEAGAHGPIVLATGLW
ncbi:MAG: exosortase, partial [Alphaproteobacteria bacterium]|nr:exosortase [Alphaproteobacteria bacterium]